LSAALLRSSGKTSTSINSLYTRNLAGAICGTVVAGFLLLPLFGVRTTIYIAAIINIAIGLATIFADRPIETALSAEQDRSASANTEDLASVDCQFRKGTCAPTGRTSPLSKQSLIPPETQLTTELGEVDDRWFWLVCAFVSGFVTISTQVAWTRLLTMIIGSSTYAFSIVVATLPHRFGRRGLSGGAAEIRRATTKDRASSRVVDRGQSGAESPYCELNSRTADLDRN